FELALRAAAVRPHQPVVGVVAVVLFVQAVAPADQVALRSPSRLSARSYTSRAPALPDWVRGVAAGGL
ncbi:TPA: hypothetical protein ACKP7I_004828, partial [Serratia marcescens]